MRACRALFAVRAVHPSVHSFASVASIALYCSGRTEGSETFMTQWQF